MPHYTSRFNLNEFEAIREPTPLRLGSMVRVRDDHYVITRRSSLGVVVHLSLTGYVKVLFFYLNHPRWDIWLNTYDQIDTFIYPLDTIHLTELSPEESSMDEVRNRITIFEARTGEPLEATYNAALAWIASGEGPSGDALLQPNRREESITDVIHRLHYRQLFYLEHQDELPSWLAGANR